MFIKYKNFNFFYKNQRFNVNEILLFLNYKDLEKENLYVTKEELINNYLDESYKEDREFINFLNKHVYEPCLNILNFMIKKNLIISKPTEFDYLWFELKNKKNILINIKFLKTMYGLCFDYNTFKLKQVFINYLNENGIKFKINRSIYIDKNNFKKLGQCYSNLIKEYYMKLPFIFIEYNKYLKDCNKNFY